MYLCSKPSIGFLLIRRKFQIPFLGFKAYVISPQLSLSLISFHATAHLTHSTLTIGFFILSLGYPKNAFASGPLHIPLPLE